MIDGMLGAIVVGIISIATVGALITASHVSSNNTHNSARSIHLKSVLTDAVPTIDLIPVAPEISVMPAKIYGQDTKIVLWKKSDPGGDIVYARTARHQNKTPDNCVAADSAPTAQAGCLITSWLVPGTVGGISISSFPLADGTDGSIKKTAALVPANTGEVRYLFMVDEAPAESTVTFTVMSGKTFDVKIPSGQIGNYYGSISLPADATTITISSTGPAAFDPTSFLLYGAPAS